LQIRYDSGVSPSAIAANTEPDDALPRSSRLN